jgi:SAM-dependent methyltransferase
MPVESSTPGNFYRLRYAGELRALQDEIFAGVFDDYFGQGGWIATADYDRLFAWLDLAPAARVLDVGCGAGAPALRLARATGCSLVGIDASEAAVAAANASAAAAGLAGRVRFECRDGGRPLEFAERSFDAIVCMDAVTHLPDRSLVFREWARLLSPGGRLVFTDQVMNGPLASDEIPRRAPGFRLLLAGPGHNERLLIESGFEPLRREDLSDRLAELAARHLAARRRHAEALRRLEGEATYQALNDYRAIAGQMARERRLCHVAFLAQRR